jgi:hypothetical protein
MNKETQTNKKQNKQTNKNSRFRNNFSHILSSGITPPVFNPVVGI